MQTIARWRLIVAVIGAVIAMTSLLYFVFHGMRFKKRRKRVLRVLHQRGTETFGELMARSGLSQRALRATLEDMQEQGELRTWNDPETAREMWTFSYQAPPQRHGRFRSRF